MPPSPAEPDTCVQPLEVRNIKHCARCGGDHVLILAMPLTRPFAPEEAGGVAWTHWAPCPTNGEPILVRVAETPFVIERSGEELKLGLTPHAVGPTE